MEEEKNEEKMKLIEQKGKKGTFLGARKLRPNTKWRRKIIMKR